MRRWPRNHRALGSILITLAFLAGCRPSHSDRSLPIEDGVRTVRVLYAGADEGIFSPTWDDTPKFLIFEPLVTYEANNCSPVVGGLAARWDPGPDWKSYARTCGGTTECR